MDPVTNNMNLNSLSAASKKMSQKTFSSNESDKEPLDVTIKRFKAENQEVINEKFISHLGKTHSTRPTINEDIQSNSVLPNASCRSPPTIPSDHQGILHKSEYATQSSRIEIYSDERNNSYQDIETGKNTSNVNEMLGEEETDLMVPENVEIMRELLLNSVNGISSHGTDKASESKELPFKKHRKVCQSSHTNSAEITDSTMKDIKQAHKISRRETWDFNDQTHPNYIQDDGINCHLKEKINARRCTQSYDSGTLTGIPKEFRIIEQPQSRNRTLQVVEHFGRNSRKNIGENIASNNNISKLGDNENTEGLIFCSGESKEENIRYVENIAAVPGPSCKETSMCSLCNKEIDEHAVLQEGKSMFMCCFCGYRSNRKHNLCLHIGSHGSEPFSCKMCGEVLKEKGTHDSEKTCNVCEGTFQCRTLLLEHSRIHTTHCIICWRGMDQHEISEYAIIYYKCCECEHKTDEKANLRSHFYSHFKERAFRCVECGQRYKNTINLARHKNENHPEK